MKIIKANEHKTSKWDYGLTTELYIYPDYATASHRDFDIRISTATCENESSVFSDYTGYTRYIMSVKSPFTLSINGSLKKLHPYEICTFKGSDAVVSSNVLRDFNVIFKDNLCVALAVFNAGEQNIKIPTGYALTYSFESEITANTYDSSYTIEKGDLLIIDPSDDIKSLSSSGKIILVTVN